MRTFVIADSSKRKAKPIGILIWDYEFESDQGVFSLQLCSECSEEKLPLSLSFCARRKDRRATPAESRDWVRSRITPETRHNIGEVLRANGLADYDEVGLLAACKGRSSDDDLLVYEVDVPQELISEYASKISCADKLIGSSATQTQSAADFIATAVRRRRTNTEISYAFVNFDTSADTARSTTPESSKPLESQAHSRAAQRIGSLIRAKRQEQGLTQKQLAARAGITQTVLSRTESGTGNPTLALLEEIAAALDLQLDLDLKH